MDDDEDDDDEREEDDEGQSHNPVTFLYFYSVLLLGEW